MAGGIGHQPLLLAFLKERNKGKDKGKMKYNKVIRIGEVDYKMEASLKTHETFKNMFGIEITKCIFEMGKSNEDEIISGLTDTIFTNLKIAWVMIKQADASFMEYEQWLDEVEIDIHNASWIKEVQELALSPFLKGKIPQDHREPSK